MRTIMDIPVNPMPAPADPKLLEFADAVVMLDKAGTLAATIADARKAHTPAKPKVTVKQADSKSYNVATKNGGSMDSRPGTITKGQLRKLIDLCVKIDEPLSAAEITNIKRWSMAQASDYRYDILHG